MKKPDLPGTTSSMTPRSRRALSVAIFFLLATFATPLHLAIDSHEGEHHESSKPDDHDHSHHESHPASDHQVIPIEPSIRPLAIFVELVAVEFKILLPEIQTWSPTVVAEANSPPAAPESPPRSPRAPPL